jgi:hypothetical protein
LSLLEAISHSMELTMAKVSGPDLR